MKLPIGRPLVGLALSGGGARGIAHIGVLEALEGGGILIDLLAGTSMGGLIAAAYAAGMSPGELEAEARRMAQASELVKLVDLFPRRGGLLTGEGVQRYLSESLRMQDRTFEDLRVPLALTSVDLETGKEVVHTQGSLVEAVMATIAVPGLFPPVKSAGRRLVDGGVLNNLPVDHAFELGADVVIAVDVGFDVGAGAPWDEESRPAFLPRIVADLYQSVMIMQAALLEQKLEHAGPHVRLRPRVPSGTSLFLGYTRAVDIMATGEAAAQQSMPEIQRLVQPALRLVWRRLTGK